MSVCACKTSPLEESWNSSPKEHSHKLTRFCFLNHPSAPPQGLGAVPFPNHFGTVSHKSWAVGAVEQRVMSWAQGANCSGLAPESFFPLLFFFFVPPCFYHKNLLLLFFFSFFDSFISCSLFPNVCFSYFFLINIFLSFLKFLFFKKKYYFIVPLLTISRKNKEEEIRE